MKTSQRIVNLDFADLKKPFKLAFTGGKGGTGKSTTALLYAFKLIKKGYRVLFLDLDVECPNDYIILGKDDIGRLMKKTLNYYPEIDEDKCQHCGLCVEKCEANALFQISGKTPKLNKDLCSSCGVCWTICPHNAINKLEFQNGAIYTNQISDNLTLVTGRSIEGVRETSPVVDETRLFVEKEYSAGSDFDVIIIDTAAGTHCSVISALEKVDFALAVTEPTPLGNHDLRIILDVLKVLYVDSGVIINQWDLGDVSLVEQTIKKKQLKLLGKIGYSKKLAQIYSKGKFWDHQELAHHLEMVKDY